MTAPNPSARLVQQRRLVTELPGPRSRQLSARRAAAVSAGVSVTLPVFIAAADGGVLLDVDGNSLIDLASGIAVTSVGNAAPAVVTAVQAQVEHFTHTCFMVTPYESYLAVCEELARLTPGEHDKRSALFNSGAEAVENAVKIARHATGRAAVVVFDHAYHGRTNLTMALTAKAMPYKHRFGPFAPEIYRVPTSYPFRDPPGMSGQQAATRALSLMDKQIGADQLACVVIEPIQGEGGFIVPAPGFLPTIAQWCTEHGVLLVADEIQTGFCRTGDWFACHHENIIPDLITTAKGIAGGLPLAAVTGRTHLMDAVHAGGLGGTYGGNPLACVAALASITTMRQHDLASAARRIETIAKPQLNALATQCPAVGQVRGRGAMLALELINPRTRQPNPELTTKVAHTCHNAGVVVLTCGTYANVIRLLPPLVIPPDLLTEGLDVLTHAILTATT